uniref:Putative secreted protein n=1 Tax=Ixodes ricinus TaxID=34613 RepID=A0A6B0UZB4_IXORI
MVLLSHLLPPVAVALQQLSVAHPLDLEDLVAHKYSTRVAVVSVLPDRGLQLLLNCKVLLVVRRQVEQHRAWSQGGVGRPSARHKLLDALHKLVPVAVRRHTNLLELLVTHLGQNVHGDPLPVKELAEVAQADGGQELHEVVLVRCQVRQRGAQRVTGSPLRHQQL